MAATPKPMIKEIKKIEHHQRKHGEESEMKPSKFHTKTKEPLKANLMKKGIKAMAKHSKEDLSKAHAHMKAHGG